jgi:hypothetical protein
MVTLDGLGYKFAGWEAAGGIREASGRLPWLAGGSGFQDTAQVRVIWVLLGPHSTILHPVGCIQDTGYNMQHTGYRNKRM